MQAIFKKTAIATIVVMTFWSGFAFCDENVMRHRGDCGPMPPPPPFGIHLLVKYQMDNLMIKTLSEMSDQTIETITTDIEENAPPYLLEKYGIAHAAFHSAMSAKIVELVNTAQTNGQITPAQATQIIDEINTFPTP